MTDTSSGGLAIPLRLLNQLRWSLTRNGEPITVGVPLPAGAVHDTAGSRIETSNGDVLAAQVRPLDRWPDGSIRWALVDFSATVEAGRALDYILHLAPGASADRPTGLLVATRSDGVQVSTGVAQFAFVVGGAFPFSSVAVDDRQPMNAERSGFRVDCGERTIDFRVASVRVHESGPLRAELEILAAPREDVGRSPVEVSARVEVFAGTATARVEFTMRNPRRAQHPSGQWELGDTGSVYLRSASLVLEVAGAIDRVRCAPEIGRTLSDVQRPFEIYQESSGGDRWNGPVHRNREGRVPMRFRGYQVRSAGEEQTAARASPILVANAGATQIAVAVPQFWQNFPRAIGVDGCTIDVGLFPRQWPEPHELQGGEQKTHALVVAFGADTVSDPPLAWCHDPLIVHASPEWSCGTGVVPYLIPAAGDSNQDYLSLVNAGIDPAVGFLAKRETADEYGWRHFGDLYADHESASQPADQPFVSHYNNQYDAIAGFVIHFLRTGDPRWWQLMADLACHVRDIDIYHTDEDKAAYDGGLFWHTLHYTDAGMSTHRSYPRGTGAGGGPASEHNYNAGLMLHYFLTGQRASRDAAIGLGRWVIQMDDGSRTVFRWLARGATGVASASGSASYHGPGRGAANSIRACLVAHQLTSDPAYAAKADELILRCIHPGDDLAARNLGDAERRWYYTVFLQALGEYLDRKRERREFDAMFGYAQASLLHYSRWMATHERPYLDRPEILEFPTETWAAQDMRKTEVFLWAALHSTGGERQTYVDRARSFFTYSAGTLSGLPTRIFTRPVVLMLTNGFRYGWYQAHASSLPEPVSTLVPSITGPGKPFETQKARAIRRARQLAVALVMAAMLLVLWRSC